MPTQIEWTDETWNPVTGCSKVSQGCKNCYALRDWPRLAANPKAAAYFGRAFTDVAVHPERMDTPLRWTKPRKIFVNSMSDLFHEAVPDDFIDQVFAVIALSSRHTFQILTKRPERMRTYMQGLGKSAKRLERAARTLGRTTEYEGKSLVTWPLPNVWLGVSVEDQAAADERVKMLLDTPAAVRWVSAEPLLGPVDLSFALKMRRENGQWREGRGLDWVVVGGESGPNARAMHPQWARALRDQCAEAGVAFLMKQWGEWVPRSACYHTFEDGRDCSAMDPGAQRWPCIRLTERGHNGRDLAHAGEGDDAYMQRVGKNMAGRLLDGVLHNDYPTGD